MASRTGKDRMTSRQCCGIERQFRGRFIALELRRYRSKGPARTTRLLLDRLRELGVEGRSLLDIGGGVGAIQHELARDGIGAIHSVEGSAGYLELARTEALRRGYADRVVYRHGDYVELAAEVPPADIVTLDRVICCYDELDRLVTLSAAKARLAYGLVFPREVWWMQVGRVLIDLTSRVRRIPFRFFVHPEAAVDAAARSAGLVRRYWLRTLNWNVVLYVRGGAPGERRFHRRERRARGGTAHRRHQ
jgi:hypothetical protein